MAESITVEVQLWPHIDVCSSCGRALDADDTKVMLTLQGGFLAGTKPTICKSCIAACAILMQHAGESPTLFII